nr:hypothetical protein [Chloroflexota bacterium]
MYNRFLGLIYAIAYALQRSKVGFLCLRIGAILLCLFAAASVAWRGWERGFAWSDAGLIVLCFLLAFLLFWADRRRYVVFRVRPVAWTDATPDLAAEEKLFLHGSGVFEVSNMSRYLVEVPVVFWTTQLAEHILAAKVRAFNILGVGVPTDERGWWYIFLEPRHVVEIQVGELCFGLRCRPAVRLLYETKKGRQPIHLSCESAAQLACLVKELRAKAQAASGVGGEGR